MNKNTKTSKKQWKDTPQARYDKANMKQLSISYKKEFTDSFKQACMVLYPNQPISQIIKKFMQDTINKANKHN